MKSLGGIMSFTNNSEWRQVESSKKIKAPVLVPLIILLVAVIECLVYTLSLIEIKDNQQPNVELSH